MDDLTGCHACRYWLRGAGENSRSPLGDCVHPEMTESGMPNEAHWDDRCGFHTQKETKA